MIKKISMLAVAAAAVSLALTGCVKAPATPVSPNLVGTWDFMPTPVVAVIEKSEGASRKVMVTVDTTQGPIADPNLAAVTQVVVSGTLTENAEEMTFTLTSDAVMVDVSPTVAPQYRSVVKTVAEQAIATMIDTAIKATGGAVMIDLNVDANPDTLTVQGSFIEALLNALGVPPSPMGLMATRDVSAP